MERRLPCRSTGNRQPAQEIVSTSRPTACRHDYWKRKRSHDEDAGRLDRLHQASFRSRRKIDAEIELPLIPPAQSISRQADRSSGSIPGRVRGRQDHGDHPTAAVLEGLAATPHWRNRSQDRRVFEPARRLNAVRKTLSYCPVE